MDKIASAEAVRREALSNAEKRRIDEQAAAKEAKRTELAAAEAKRAEQQREYERLLEEAEARRVQELREPEARRLRELAAAEVEHQSEVKVMAEASRLLELEHKQALERAEFKRENDLAAAEARRQAENKEALLAKRKAEEQYEALLVQARRDAEDRELSQAVAGRLDEALRVLKAKSERDAAAAQLAIAERDWTIEEQKSRVKSRWAQLKEHAENEVQKSRIETSNRDNQLEVLKAQIERDAQMNEINLRTIDRLKAQATNAAVLKDQAEKDTAAANSLVAERDLTIKKLNAQIEKDAAASAAVHRSLEKLQAQVELEGSADSAAKANSIKMMRKQTTRLLPPPPPQRGIVRVHLTRAALKQRSDGNNASLPLPDPYVTMRLGGHAEASAAIEQTLNPVYNSDFSFSFDSLVAVTTDVLRLEVKNANDPIAVGKVDLVKHKVGLEAGEKVDCTINLNKPGPGGGHYGSQLFLQLWWEAAEAVSLE